MDLADLKSKFLEYLEIEKGRSRKTTENYNHYIDRFLDWSKISHPEEITDELISRYRIYLNRFQDTAGKNLKKTTQSYYVIALRSFLKYMAKKNIPTLQAEKVEIGKTPKKEVEFLRAEEVERILEAADGADFK